MKFEVDDLGAKIGINEFSWGQKGTEIKTTTTLHRKNWKSEGFPEILFSLYENNSDRKKYPFYKYGLNVINICDQKSQNQGTKCCMHDPPNN